MDKKIYRTTIKDFEYFVERVEFWQKVLGGTPYKIYCLHTDNGDKHNHAKFEKWDDVATIKIFLNKKVDSAIEINKKELDNTAFNEVLDALYFSTLRGQARGTYSDFEVDYATHKAVMMASNSIFKALRGY